MNELHRQRIEQRKELAQCLDPAVLQRGVIQRFFVSPVLPMEPLQPPEIASAWRRLATEIQADRAPELLSLYVHIPFCAHRCRYCVYYSVETKQPGLVEAYLERLHAEIDYYADAVSGIGFSTCYIGGGTPTVLEEGPLESLLTHLNDAFTRKRGGEWGFECNPATVSEAKAELFRAHGFNRVSFGVQSLNPQVLDGVGRGYQTRQHVVETFRIMKRCNFCINVDLMHGLPGQTSESLLGSLESLLDLEPTQVTIYALSPYTPMEVEVGVREPLASLAEKVDALCGPRGFRSYAGTTHLSLLWDDDRSAKGAERLLPKADDLLAAEYSRFGKAHIYDDITVEPFSLLGIGPTARSYVYGQLRYMNDQIPVEASWTPTENQATGRFVDIDEERRRYVVDGLERKGGVKQQEYEARFGEPLADHFGEELLCGVELGLLEQAEGRIRIKPLEPEARFTTALLFVDDSTVQAVLAASADTGDQAEDENEDQPEDQPEDDTKDGAGSSAGGGPVQGSATEGPLALALRAHGQEVVVHLADHEPGDKSYHRKGGFVFYLPSAEPDGISAIDQHNEMVLDRFTRLFDRVVTRESPADLRDLHERLLSRFGR